MRRIRKIGVVLYLISAVVVVGLFAGSQFGPHTDRFNALLAVPWVHVLAFACVCVVLIQMAVLLIAAIADKPEPTFLRLPAMSRSKSPYPRSFPFLALPPSAMTCSSRRSGRTCGVVTARRSISRSRRSLLLMGTLRPLDRICGPRAAGGRQYARCARCFRARSVLAEQDRDRYQEVC